MKVNQKIQPDTLFKTLSNINKKRTTEFTKDEIIAIHQAMKSDNPNLKSKCCLVVHECLLAYECDIMKKYGIKKGHQDFGDYINEMFIVIMTQLESWNPNRASLSTYLTPYFEQVCTMQQKNKRPCTSSRYYENIGNLVNHAVDALRKKNSVEPTVYEIQAYIKMTNRQEVAIQTIERFKSMNQESISIDSNPWVGPDAVAGDPEEEYLKKEKKQDIQQTIASMEPCFRKIMVIIYEIYTKEQIDGNIPNSDIAELYNERYGTNVSSDYIKLMRISANREFIKIFKKTQYQETVPVQNITVMMEQAKQEEDDIILNISNIFQTSSMTYA